MMTMIFSSETVKHSVWVVVINPKGHILIAKRSKSSNNPNVWNFPGGGLEPFESELKCARRELQEELGISYTKLDYEGKHRVKTRDRDLTVFLYSSKEMLKVKPNKAEVQSVKWVDIDKLEADSMLPNKWHFPTFMLLHNEQVFTAIKILVVGKLNPTKS